MLAHLNIAILCLWLIAEIVPMLADNLAKIERQIRSSHKATSKKDD